MYKENSFDLRGNLIYYSSIKNKRIIQSILVSEIYRIIRGIDIVIMINTIIKTIISQLGFLVLLIIVYTDSYLLYEYLIKLRIIKEKRLMIDIIVIYQLYK